MGNTPDAERTPIYGLGVWDIIAAIALFHRPPACGESPLMRVALGWAGCGTKSHVAGAITLLVVLFNDRQGQSG